MCIRDSHSVVRLDQRGRSGSIPGCLIRRRLICRRSPARPVGTAPKPRARLGCAPSLVGLGTRAREVVGAFVHMVPSVALDPLEGDAAPFHGAVDLLNELQVLDGLLVRDVYKRQIQSSVCVVTLVVPLVAAAGAATPTT